MKNQIIIKLADKYLDGWMYRYMDVYIDGIMTGQLEGWADKQVVG